MIEAEVKPIKYANLVLANIAILAGSVMFPIAKPYRRAKYPFTPKMGSMFVVVALMRGKI